MGETFARAQDGEKTYIQGHPRLNEMLSSQHVRDSGNVCCLRVDHVLGVHGTMGSAKYRIPIRKF
jgi:hypothetical protein